MFTCATIPRIHHFRTSFSYQNVALHTKQILATVRNESRTKILGGGFFSNFWLTIFQEKLLFRRILIHSVIVKMPTDHIHWTLDGRCNTVVVLHSLYAGGGGGDDGGEFLNAVRLGYKVQKRHYCCVVGGWRGGEKQQNACSAVNNKVPGVGEQTRTAATVPTDSSTKQIIKYY